MVQAGCRQSRVGCRFRCHQVSVRTYQTQLAARDARAHRRADLAEASQLLGYPEESVGRLMTPDYIRLRAEWTVEQAIAHIRKYGRDSEIFTGDIGAKSEVNDIYRGFSGIQGLYTIDLHNDMIARRKVLGSLSYKNNT